MSKSKTRLYFGKLHETTRERDLEKFVRGYGKIREISVKRGYGFVEFYDPRDAEDVVYELNGRDLLGERVIIEHAREPSSRRDYGYVSYSSRSSSGSRSFRPSREYQRNIPVRTDHRLAVENLSSRVNWQELKAYFNKVGEVTFSDAHKRKTGLGIVEFATKDDMKAALKKLDGTELNGRKLKLSIEKVGSRSRSRSRSGGRNRRSRSRSPKRRRHRSRSRSPKRSRSKSPSKNREEKEASRSRSRSRSQSKSEEAKSRSQSPEKEGEESNRESGNESANESPQKNGDEEENVNEEDDE